MSQLSQSSKFKQTFNLNYPIIQSPMAGASTVELASTITKLGGLGSIPLGSFSNDPQKIEIQFKKFQSLTNGSNNVNLNFFAHDEPSRDSIKEQNWVSKFEKIYKENGIIWNHGNLKLNSIYPTFKSIDSISDPTIQLLIKLKPSVISFHFGLPSVKIIKYLQSNGIKIFVSITNLQELKLSLNSKIDGIILQGFEAGGHRGNFQANDLNDSNLKIEELTEIVLDYLNSNVDPKEIPFIIAAGGFYSSSQIKQFITKFNISAIQLGTIWLPSVESTISSKHLSFFQNLNSDDKLTTIMSSAISGRNLRTISTPFLTKLQTWNKETPEYPLPYELFKKLGKDYTSAIEESITDHSKESLYGAFLAGENFNKSWKGTRNTEDIFEDIVKDL
ncbi:hypothetical protein WICMUC_004697 [Wickerhamomyces mucosus]|uniref:Nitronate monooxygenase domain-containing protein n=1 Tax=Wickerhamomyces mucosus TaxID=1378264 RepID=A0A9P8PGV8_9ASCO|nr:hypothetical protein WICMUC_004697 [Wickerhamomyces mucosus]